MNDQDITKTKIQNLHKSYVDVFKGYCDLFAEKHNLSFGPTDINVNDPIFMSDYFIDFNDIRYDLENEIEVGEWEKWYDMMLELGMLGAQTCNFPSWCNGFRPYTEEQITGIKEAHQQLQEMKENLKRLIDKDQ